MYLEFIPIIITISLTIFMFFYSKELKRNEPIKQAKALDSVKNNLKNIKNKFDNQGEYIYNIKDSSTLLYVVFFILALGGLGYFGYSVFFLQHSRIRGDIKGLIGSALLAFLMILTVIAKNNIKNIKLDNSELTIKSEKYTKKYNIHEIDELKIEIITTHGYRGNAFKTPFLNIKDKNNRKQDCYEVKYTSLNNITAIVIYINLMKQNKLNTIDIITEEEIKKLENEILI